MNNNVSPAIRHALSILGINPDTPYEECKRIYRKILLTTHPDKGGNAKDFIAIQDAWKIAQPFLELNINERTQRSQKTPHIRTTFVHTTVTVKQTVNRTKNNSVKDDNGLIDDLPIATLYTPNNKEYLRLGFVTNLDTSSNDPLYQIVVTYTFLKDKGIFYADKDYSSFNAHVTESDVYLKHRDNYHILVYKQQPFQWERWLIYSPYYHFNPPDNNTKTTYADNSRESDYSSNVKP